VLPYSDAYVNGRRALRSIPRRISCSTWNIEAETGPQRGTALPDDLSDEQHQALSDFAALIRMSPHNLLSPRALLEIETRHIPESIAFARSLPAGTRLLDVGSGGGFPGVVIALVRPEYEVHLLEATGKKAAFLTEVADRLGVTYQVHHGRAEDLGRGDLAGKFDAVTARAVAPLARLVSWCAPYLRTGGQLHAIKGERWAEDLDSARAAIRIAGLRIVAVPGHEDESPVEGRPRVVVLELDAGGREGHGRHA